ncbi:uncharacterized protein [Watersipora subatra]|uniref:uncharacterized protein n=1 Tax=Watersipora subatra TaxID=2589382 RepID=UPI00355C1409
MIKSKKLRNYALLLTSFAGLIILYIGIASDADSKLVEVFNQSDSLPLQYLVQQSRLLRQTEFEANKNPKTSSSSTTSSTTTVRPPTTTPTPKYNHTIDNEYRNPLMTICEAYEGLRAIPGSQTYGPFNRTETYENCRRTCGLHDNTYATLVKGICNCFDLDFNNKEQIDLERCDATCTLSQPECITRFKKHSITMRTGYKDGNVEWTTWMNMKDLGLKVRYRGCPRTRFLSTECVPEYERKNTTESTISSEIGSKLIGCFTARSIVTSELSNTIFHQTFYQQKKHKNQLHYYLTRDKLHKLCINFCSIHISTYALLSSESSSNANRTCHCTNNLLQSQPTDSCDGLGFVAYWLPPTLPVKLKFSGETKKKGKVLVLGRYRSGSSMTQSFFSRFPDSFTVFEPCKVMHRPPGSKPTERALLAGLEAFYNCDVFKLPLYFHSTQFVRWTTSMLNQRGSDNNYMADILECFESLQKTDCAPYWLEACQRSSFLNVKVIRVFSISAIKEFTKKNSDVQVLHLVRDPRALLSAQRLYGTQDDPAEVCNQMVSAGKMVKEMKKEGVKNIHEVFYEDMAMNASRSGARIYRELGFEMPQEVEAFLNREDIQNLEALPKSVSEVVVLDDPKYHIYRFLERYTLVDILNIDGNCTNVYRQWPGHYRDFNTVIAKHGAEIEKFISARRPFLAQYIRRMRKSPP